MINRTVVKVTLFAAGAFLSLSTAATAKASTITSDKPIAGITQKIDEYYEAVPEDQVGEAEAVLETISSKENPDTKKMTEVVSPYANLGISIANDYVNIRKEPNTESEIVGKLYRGCATDILEVEGEWVKIHSGKVDGYIKAEYLAIGEEAAALIGEFATKYATVNTETLFVREGQGTDTKIINMVPLGESYYVINEYDEWAEIMIDDAETGFVSKELVSIDVEFEYAISIEEEQAKLAAEEAARQAEIERLEALAREQEAERAAEAAKKAEAQRQAEAAQKAASSNTSNSSSNTSNTPKEPATETKKPSSSGSGSGQKIADYGVMFVGNPYVYGGESLTNGADCSGFVRSIYSHFGKSIRRTSIEQSQSAGYVVDISERQPGDLIFYRNSSGTVNHVAIYIGNDRIVHASNQRDGIKISNYKYRTPYIVRRVF
jgi:cell wall-associated NlpC family hydrolase